MSGSEPITAQDEDDASLALGMLGRQRRADEAGARRLLASLRRRLFDTPAPDALGRYVLGEELGAGGAGVVVRAHDPDLGRDVAIKLVHTGFDRGTAEHVASSLRMLREAQALARVEHPNVVRVFDVGTYDRAPGDRSVYFVMELAQGQTLAKWLARDRSWREVTRAFAQAARGLAAAHAEGIVHRDFKPSNAIIDDSGVVRVLDFGLARGATDIEPSSTDDATPPPFPNTLTASGVVVGTPPYMAPEQHREAIVDARVDQFALCVSLYEGIFGQRPFPQTDPVSLIAAKRERRVTIPPTPAIPRTLADALLRGLAPDPAQRHPDMNALAERLESVLRPSSRWATWALAGVTVALGVVGFVSSGVASTTERCEQDARELAAWDDASAERIATAFAGSEMRYAETAKPQVIERFAAQASAIDSTWRDVCIADDPRLPAQLRCLHARREEMLALVDALAEGGPLAVARSVGAVQGLVDPATCRDPDETADVPETEEQAAIGRELARLIKMFELGRTDEVRAALPELAQRAEAAQATRLRYEIRMFNADVELDSGDHRIALAELEAAGHAASANGDNGRAAEAWFYLAFLYAQYQGRIEDARRMLRHGEAAAAELGDDFGRTRDALAARFAILVAEGDYAAALEVAERAYVLCADLWGEDDPRLIDAEARVAIALRRLGRIDDAIVRLEAMIERGREGLGIDHPDLVLLHGNLGVALLDRGDEEAALEQMQRVLELLDLHGDNDSLRRVTAMTYVADIHHRLGADDIAERVCHEALDLLARIGEADGSYAAVVRASMGRALGGRGDHEGAVEQFQIALDIHTRLDALGRSIPQAHRDLAAALLEVGRIDDAREHARLAAELSLEVFGEGSPDLAQSEGMVARVEGVKSGRTTP